MVKIFLSGIGGSGKTTLIKDLLREKTFKDYGSVMEIARNIMERKSITKDMIGRDIHVHMLLQDEIVKDQRKEGEHLLSIPSLLQLFPEERLRNSDYISDRCIMDCFAVIRLRMTEKGGMTEEDMTYFKTQHKVSLDRR